jgi:tRNA A-37 threonylcarbamoyl transferase component Bud32
LTEEERSDLITMAVSWVPAEDIISMCAWGPKVAGYGTEISSRDLIIVTNNVPDAEQNPDATRKEPSPIFINEKDLQNEAEGSSSDESVVRRFLNVYEPLVNAGFLQKVEASYKKRILSENLIQLQSDYGDFSPNLIIPMEYFLFNKLHDLVIKFPDQVYDIVHTYSDPWKIENTDIALEEFIEAAKSFASEGIIGLENGSIRIFRDREQRDRALSLLRDMHPQSSKEKAKNTKRSLASKIGVKPKTKPIPEPTAKIDVGPLVELDRPRKLLRLEEGAVFDDADMMVHDLAAIYGMTGAYEHEEKKMGDITNSSSKLEIWGEGKREKFILKPFQELRSAKWYILNVWALTAKRFKTTPLSRLDREVDGVRRLHKLGIKTHRIAGIILDERTLVTEFTDGVSLDHPTKDVTDGKSKDTGQIEAYARVLATMHQAGLVYGDTKPANALVGKDGIYLLDLEQTVENGDMAWDLAEFLYYSARSAKQVEGMKLVADSFLAAYRVQNGSQVIRKAIRMRYLDPFFIFVSPRMWYTIRRSLKKYSSPI